MGELVGASEPTINRIQRMFVASYILPVTHDHLVLEAFRLVDRANFVPDSHILEAYANKPLPLTPDGSATISQPEIVGMMLDNAGLTGNENVLEVGTGARPISCAATIQGQSRAKGFTRSSEFSRKVGQPTSRRSTVNCETVSREEKSLFDARCSLEMEGTSFGP